jgi:hypothetical protein
VAKRLPGKLRFVKQAFEPRAKATGDELRVVTGPAREQDPSMTAHDAREMAEQPQDQDPVCAAARSQEPAFAAAATDRNPSPLAASHRVVASSLPT